jgi:hypothetical protein
VHPHTPVSFVLICSRYVYAFPVLLLLSCSYPLLVLLIPPTLTSPVPFWICVGHISLDILELLVEFLALLYSYCNRELLSSVADNLKLLSTARQSLSDSDWPVKPDTTPKRESSKTSNPNCWESTNQRSVERPPVCICMLLRQTIPKGFRRPFLSFCHV